MTMRGCGQHERNRAGAILTALLLAYTALLAGCGERVDPASSDTTIPVELDGREFELELALTHARRYQGLSDRESIAEDGGMLFVFPSPRRTSFVMRRCLVPIDLIFLDPGGRIVTMHHMPVEPYDTPEWRLTRYDSRYPIQFAIELRGGALEQLDLEPGQRIDLPTQTLKNRAR